MTRYETQLRHRAHLGGQHLISINCLAYGHWAAHQHACTALDEGERGQAHHFGQGSFRSDLCADLCADVGDSSQSACRNVGTLLGKGEH